MTSRRRATTSLDNRPTTRQLVQALPGAMDVPLACVVADPDQPRTNWQSEDSEERLAQLTESVREFGILQPLLVRSDPQAAEDEPRFIVIAGGRRREAAARAGLLTIPVVMREAEGTRIRILQLLENIQRQALAPLDEARAMKEVLDAQQVSAEELGRQLHISGQTVRDRLAILADQIVSDSIQRGQITQSVGRLILKLPRPEREEFYGRLRAGDHIITAGVVEARKKRLQEGQVHPDRRGPGRSVSAGRDQDAVPVPTPSHVQKTFEQPAVSTADVDTADTEQRPATGGPAAPVTAADPVVGAPRPGTSDAQAEQARRLARVLAPALWRGLKKTEQRAALTDLREGLASPAAGAWATALLVEVVTIIEQTQER